MKERQRRLPGQASVFFKRCARFAVRRVLYPAIYRLACLQKIDPGLVYFVNDGVTAPGDNFLPLMEALEQEGYRCVFFGNIDAAGRLRKYLWLARFYVYYARARAVFLMESCQLADSCKPRRGTQVIQLWHGCGAFKRFGWSTVDLDWGPSPAEWKWFPVHRCYTYACVSAPEVIPHFAEAYHCPESIFRPWGAPRTDFYFKPGVTEDCRKQVRRAFPEIGGRRMVLYAPTFRGSSVAESYHDGVLDYEAMERALGKDCALLLRPHPRAAAPIPLPEEGKTPFAFDARGLPIEVLLCAADLVISDYSSLIFEYALLERPMLFYAYDLDDYERARSFYYPYVTFVPGDLVWDTDDLIAGIRRNLFEGGFDSARVRAFREKFMSACDGHRTARILRNTLGI